MSLIQPDWPTPSAVQSLFSTRSGGVSKAPFDSLNLGDHVGDQTQDVLTNRSIFTQDLPNNPLWLQQTHSTVVSTPASRSLAQNTIIEADASVSNTPGEVLVIMTADCLPVLFTNKQGTVVGAAHAGWRGLCSGVLENTIAEMLGISGDAKADDFLVWMGPAIGPDSYEVGVDVLNAFKESNLPFLEQAFKPIQDKPGKFLFDIYQFAKGRLKALGIQSIYGGEYCTARDRKQFFSYRRDGQTGRFASAIWIAK